MKNWHGHLKVMTNLISHGNKKRKENDVGVEGIMLLNVV